MKLPSTWQVNPRVSDALVELVDFPATVYELAGIEPGYSHFGKSLVPLLNGDVDFHRDAVFAEGGRLYGEMHAMEISANVKTEGLYWPKVSLQTREDGPYHTKAAMCRMADSKYVHRLYEPDELYDLRADPNEVHNVAEDSNYTTLLLQHKERMLKWYIETSDVVPFDEDSGVLDPLTP